MKNYISHKSVVSGEEYVRRVTHILWCQMKLPKRRPERPSLETLYREHPKLETFIKFALFYKYHPTTIMKFIREQRTSLSEKEVIKNER